MEFDDQSCPSEAMVDSNNQPHPPSLNFHTSELYFQLARNHFSKADGWCSASHDAWTMALNYFTNQPLPKVDTNLLYDI